MSGLNTDLSTLQSYLETLESMPADRKISVGPYMVIDRNTIISAVRKKIKETRENNAKFLRNYIPSKVRASR